MLEPKLIYETANFLAIDKPAGLMVHAAKLSSKREKKGGERADEPTVVDWLVKRYPEAKTVGDDPALRPGIVHRLDRATSGVMLIAKNQEYFEYLKSLFQKHEVQKTYYAVVAGIPKNREGTINVPIGIQAGTLKRSVRSTKMQKDAITKYKVLKSYELPGTEQEVSLLEVAPKTGRTHQIRVHLASLGNPIIGDHLYGSRTSRGLAPRLMLHAAAIEFSDKDGSRVRVDAYPQPKDFPI